MAASCGAVAGWSNHPRRGERRGLAVFMALCMHTGVAQLLQTVIRL